MIFIKEEMKKKQLRLENRVTKIRKLKSKAASLKIRVEIYIPVIHRELAFQYFFIYFIAITDQSDLPE